MIPERLVPGAPEWDLYYVEHKQRYDFFSRRCCNLSVLDAACGVGYGSQILARAGARSVLGMDISSDATSYAQAHFAHPNAEFIRADVLDLSRLGRAFDVVISFETIEHLTNPERFVAGVRRVLKPGGLFVCSTPNKEFSGNGKTANPYHLSELTFTEFTGLFRKYFEIEEQYHQSHSPAYLRHVELLRELERVEKQLRFSRCMRLERSLRHFFRRSRWENGSLPVSLWKAVPGDFVVEPVDKPVQSHLTFILVGRPKACISSEAGSESTTR